MDKLTEQHAVANWLDQLGRIGRRSRWAAGLIREGLERAAEGDGEWQALTDDGWQWDHRLDQAASDLREGELTAVGMGFGSSAEDGTSDADLEAMLASVVGPELAAQELAPVFDALHRAASEWGEVQARLRRFRNRLLAGDGSHDLAEARAELESDARQLRQVSRILEAASDAWRAAFERRHPPSEPKTPAFRSANWFNKATAGQLDSDRLRKAGEDGRLQRERGNGNRWHYAVPQVCRRWPEYESMILRALENQEN